MRIENYVNDTFYEHEYFSEIRVIDPNDLYSAIVFFNVFLFQNGIPYKAQTWRCRPSADNIGWMLYVSYTFAHDRGYYE